MKNNDFETTLDLLIQNAKLLGQACEDAILDGTQASLQSRQEHLLDNLFKCQHQLSTNPQQYLSVERKIATLSSLNARLLVSTKTRRPTKERFVKKARVHRNRKRSIQG